MKTRALWLAVLTAMVVSTYLFLNPSTHAHRIYYNGTVLTMDNDNRVVEAIAIRDGLIEAVGSNADVKTWQTPRTELVDLDGKTLMPGLIDAHSHFPVSGLFAVTADLRPPPIGGVDTIPRLLAALKTYDATSDRDWVIGFGYDDSFLREQRHPTRAELDSVVNDKPVYIWHSSGHMGVANTQALAALGIDPELGYTQFNRSRIRCAGIMRTINTISADAIG
ncbi:MAG: amidohydrolase family protein [Pseudomonadota bacterium]